jgi:hypothetical protein
MGDMNIYRSNVKAKLLKLYLLGTHFLLLTFSGVPDSQAHPEVVSALIKEFLDRLKIDGNYSH